jgi:lipoprotein NlpI
VSEALTFVQSEIRYFSVSLGESSHRPTQPDVVLQRRYGDCKDKSLLLMTLLQGAGIQSRPVLLQLGRRKRLEKALASPQLFNHVIVQVRAGGSVFYLDPTLIGQDGQLKRMGQLHEGSQVLVVAPETRQLTTIDTANVRELTRNEVIETASLPKLGGDGELKVRQVWYGAIAERLRLMHERIPRDQLVKSIGNSMESRYPGAKLIGEPDIQDDRARNAVSVTATYSVPKLATERDGNWIIRYTPSNMKGALSMPGAATRAAPLLVPAYPYDARYTFEVTFPGEVSVVRDPSAQTVNSKYFTYSVSSSFRGNVAKSTAELRTLASEVDIADIQSYAEQVRAVNNVPIGAIVVPKVAIKSVSGAVAKKDFAQTLRDRLEETVQKTTQAINSGKLTGNDLVGSHCLRGSARSDLGKVEEALADGNEAVKLAPNSSEALVCRASAYFDAGQLDKSIADYSKAITLGASHPKVLHQRGIAKFYSGKLEEAAEDFAKASDTGDKELQVYNDLWLAWTHQRLGKPLPEDLLTRAAAEPRGDWPRPALALTAGHLTPADMLKLIERKSGDDRRMASSEGYFYLGQYHLGRGDKAKAREAFEKGRQLNVFIYTEHKAAALELQQLGAPPGKDSAKSAAPPAAAGKAPAAPAVTGSVSPKEQTTGAPPVETKKAAKKPSPKASDAWAKDLWKQ